MPVYAYRAVTQRGEQTTGELEARSLKDLAILLEERDMLLITCRQSRRSLFDSFGKPKADELIQLFYSLGTMLKSGLTVPQTLELAEKALKSGKLKRSVGSMLHLVRKGSSLAEAFEKNKAVFPDFTLEPIKVAELTGRLPETIIALAGQMKKNKEINGKIKNASMYPAFVCIALVGLITVVFNVVLPRVLGAIKQVLMGRQMPPTTAFIVSIEEKLEAIGPYIPLIAVLIVGGYFAAQKVDKARKALDRVKLKTPHLGQIITYRELINLLRVMTIAVKSGISMDKGLAMTEKTIKNTVLKEKIRRTRQMMASGEILSTSLRAVELDPYLDAMVVSGEISGSLDATLENTLEHYTTHVNEKIDRLFALIEPLIILVLGLVVLGVLAGALVPLWESMQYVGKIH